MAVRIRLKKFGRKHRPFFRIVAVDVRRPRDGRVLEELGTYDPLVPKDEKDARVTLKEDRVLYWLSVGAQPSDKVAVMIKKYVDFPEVPKLDYSAKPKQVPAGEQLQNPYVIHNLVEKYGQTGTAKKAQEEARARLAEKRRSIRGFSASLADAKPAAFTDALASDAE